MTAYLSCLTINTLQFSVQLARGLPLKESETPHAIVDDMVIRPRLLAASGNAFAENQRDGKEV